MNWINSEGGPLLLIQREYLDEWRGVHDGSGDYDRACAIVDEIGIVAVDGGEALVLGDEPLATTWRPDEAGGSLLRWVYGTAEAEALKALSSSTRYKFPTAPHATFATGGSGQCILFDSAEMGAELDCETISISLRPGVYLVDSIYVDINVENSLLVHRFRVVETTGS